MKNQNYGETYNYIDKIYADLNDREGYVLVLKQNLDKNLQWKLLNFEIVGVKILGTQSYVVAEQHVEYKLPGQTKRINKTTQVQYELFAKGNEWKINASRCIINCESLDELVDGPDQKHP